MRSPTPTDFKVAALYRFHRVERPDALRGPISALCRDLGIRGTLILAEEGVNGTVAGTDDAVDTLLDRLREVAGIDAMELKFSRSEAMPFHRMKVRVKREIVTMGVEGLDPVHGAGTYVEPRDWNRLVDDPATLVIDTRNRYEVGLGTFAGAIDPETRGFRDFPAWVERNRSALEGRKVAMFCTGGIRCEKATAYLRSLGMDEVFHLRGGILKYLEEVPAEDSRWQGECFVFDERVSVVHGLAEGEAELCRACRHPLTPADRGSPLFAPGVSCPNCHDARSDGDRARYAERHRQVELAGRRGADHIGQRLQEDV